MPKRVLVVSARMGAGHDGAAKELCTRLEKRGHQTRMVDFLDASPRFGKFLKDTYELQLARAPWTYDMLYRLWTWASFLTPPLVFLLSIFFERGLRQWAEEFEADAIVTTYPFASVVLGRARLKRRNRLQIPVSTFLTDFAVHPLWVHKGIDAHICVHPRAAQAVYNLTGEFASAPGPLVSSAFRGSSETKEEARIRLGIPQDKIAILIVAGSWGVGELEDTFDALIKNPDFFPIAACGRNKHLAQRLRQRNTGLVLTWTDEMPAYMRVSDVVVQNAGGLTCMEAFASELPVVSYNPIPGHGRQNVFEMTAAGLTKWARTKEHLSKTIYEVVNSRDELANEANAIFAGDAVDNVERLLYGEVTPRIVTTKPLSRRFAGIAAAISMIFVSVNLVANIATSNGLNVTTAAYQSGNYAYLAVVMGPANINNIQLDNMMEKDNIAAIITGRQTLQNKAGVTAIANSGVAIANGGWDTSSDLHLLTPDNAVAHAMTLIEQATNETVNIYAPQMGVNTVDLAWASIHHQTIIRPFNIGLALSKGPITLKSHQIYEIDATRLTTAQVEADINQLTGIFHAQHFAMSPLWTIR